LYFGRWLSETDEAAFASAFGEVDTGNGRDRQPQKKNISTAKATPDFPPSSPFLSV